MLKHSICSFFILLSISFQVTAEKITLAADVWCPINCLTTDVKVGYMVEIAQLIFNKHDIDVDYQIMPWARAIHEAERGGINGVIGAFKGDAPNFIFPKQELGIIGNSFFALSTSNWQYTTLNSLHSVTLGIIKDYDYGPELAAYIDDPKNSERLLAITGDKSVSTRAIQMLMAERVDVLIESDLVFWHSASQLQLTNQLKRVGQSGPAEKAYIAFSPEHPQSTRYAEILSQGMIKLRATGELAIILAKYGLTDWK